MNSSLNGTEADVQARAETTAASADASETKDDTSNGGEPKSAANPASPSKVEVAFAETVEAENGGEVERIV